MEKRTLYSLESDIRRILEGHDFVSTGDEGGKQWYMNLVTDLAIFVQQELGKAREGEIQKILDKMPQYVERNGREYYLDFYIKDISGERYYCSCYTNGDKKLTPEYDEEILLRSLVKTRDYLSKLKE